MLRKFLLISLGLWAPIGAWALGLGDIKLNSSLNEPLSAEIEIAISDPTELIKFSAKVASTDTFTRYGLDRPVFLNSFDFQLRKTGDTSATLYVTSRQAITEPFVTFLVEANWERGRLLREYTVLLDPPVFNDQAVAAPVSVAQSVTAQPTYSSGQILQPATPAPAPLPTPAPVYRPVVIAGDTYGPVRRNENLWNISKSALADGVSINQMMVAIYRANPQAFMGNINLLKEGATLQIPNSDSVRDLNRATANNVVVEHNSNWRGGRVNTRVASSSSGTSTSSPKRLELIAPDNDPGGVGGGASAQELEKAQDMLAQEQAENDRLGGEIDDVRAELEETKRLLNLRNSSLAELQQSLDSETSGPGASVDSGIDQPVEQPITSTAPEPGSIDTPVDTSGSEPVVSTATDPTVTAPTEPVVEAPVTIAAQPAVEEPGIISKIFGWLSNWWLYAAAIAVGLLSILGVVFYMLRGRDKTEVESWDSSIASDETDLDLDASLDKVAAQSEATNVLDAAEVEYFEDTGTFKPIDFNANESADAALLADDAAEFPFEDTMAGETGVKLDQQDALSEADFHLAYGLYDQAAQLVGKAAEKEPNRLDLQSKLLEIYFVWGNKDEFRSKAESIKSMLGDANPGEWEKIMIMGKQICPDDELFAGDASAPIMVDSVDLALEESAYTELDFSTGSDDAADDYHDDNVVDLDLGDALFASDDAPTSAGTVDNELEDHGLDFSFDLDSPVTAVDDSPTAAEPEVKEKIEQALSAADGEDTEEMDLDQLGIDLDFGDITSVSAGTSGEFGIAETDEGASAAASEEDFDELFAGLDDLDDVPDASSDIAAANVQTTATPTTDFDTRDKLLDTSELKVEMEELLAAEVPGMMDTDETASGVEQLDGDTGSFSAEIRALSDDALDIGEELAATGIVPDDFGLGDDDETVLQETLVVGTETPDITTDTDFDEIFAGADDDTQLSEALIDVDGPIDLDLADAFSSDTTAMPEMSSEPDSDVTSTSEAITFHGVFDAPPSEDVPPADDFSADVFGGGTDGHTQEMRNIDLDVGEKIDESSDGTTVRVATSNLALPENVDLAINEVGTKLDLARAYLDMGDPDGARGILEEVLQEGNDTQQIDARQMLESLS